MALTAIFKTAKMRSRTYAPTYKRPMPLPPKMRGGKRRRHPKPKR